MATIRDVAARANVSVATVSHVMNGSRRVNDETRQRVLDAIHHLKYRRHGIARSLRRSKSGAIGVIISDITNPFFADLVRGIETAIQEIDPESHIILSNTDEDAAKELQVIDVLMEKRVDGLILAPAGGNEGFLSDLVSRAFPMVFVDRALPQVDADSVVVDNTVGARRIVEHLIALGHRRIAAMRATLHATSIDARISGYQTALREAGIKPDPRLVIESASEIGAAYAAGQRVLALDPIPEAVFCSNNFTTLGLIRAIHAAGLRCPDDIAVVGFDDFPWADSFHPQLTAVSQPAFAMGEDAIRLLFDRINERRTGKSVQLTLSTDLVVRESCGALIKRGAPTP
ncbi:MAG: LacI family DNA-binding transcriptional regulator [Bauldia sp.]|nr:LacI family DNA-binding transcriptional regulator [Bauldia sp.]